MPVDAATASHFNTAPFTLGVTEPHAGNTGYGVLGYTPASLSDQGPGSLVVTTNGTTVQGLRIHGAVSIQASNVTVQGCHIVGLPGETYSDSIRGLITNVSGTGNVAQYNELTQWDANAGADNSIYWREGLYLTGGGLTAYRNDIHDANHLAYITGGTHTIQGNYLHEPGFRTDDADHSGDATHPNWSHNDGVHIRGGTSHVVQGNSFVMKWSKLTGMNATENPDAYAEQVWPNCHCQLFQAANNALTGLVIDRNWYKYGSVCFFLTTCTFTGGNITFTGNRITPDQSLEFSQYVQARIDPTTDWGTITVGADNVYSHDPDTPASVQGTPLSAPTGTTTKIWAYNVNAHTP
jgi:hypothetical protein